LAEPPCAGIAPGKNAHGRGELLALGLRAEAADLLWRRRPGLRHGRFSVVEEAEATACTTSLHSRPCGCARWRAAWEVPPALLRVAYLLDFSHIDAEGRGTASTRCFSQPWCAREFRFSAGRMRARWTPGDAGDGRRHARASTWMDSLPLTCRPSQAPLRRVLPRPDQTLFDSLLALAAHNAGPGNAQRWSAAARGATGADLLEVVDISETNSYVQYVVEHYAHYEAAYR
jgi:hypothetical protein